MSMRAVDENTEVLLTEFVEGTLSPARRAEIETYLAAHPREKEVLDQLLDQRVTLRRLPSESPPPDIHDSIQSQLERSVLLDYFAEIQSPPRSIGMFRSQVLTAAALVVLSTGIFATVYFVVAPPNERSVDVALAHPNDERSLLKSSLPKNFPPTAEAFSAPGNPTGPLASASRSGDVKPLTSEPTGPAFSPPVASPPAQPESHPALRSGVSRSSPPPAPQGVSPTPDRRLATTLPSAPFPLAEGAVPIDLSAEQQVPTRRIVIYTPDPDGTRARVELLLRSGGWTYLSTPAPLPTSVSAFRASASTSRPNLTYGPPPSIPSLPAPLETGKEPALPQSDHAAAKGIGPVPNPLLLVRVEGNQVEALIAALPKLAAPSTTEFPATHPVAPETETAEAATRSPSDRPATAPASPAIVNLLVDIRLLAEPSPPSPSTSHSQASPPATQPNLPADSHSPPP